MAMSIRASKVFVDFKGELSCMLMKTLQDLGETVYIINPFQLFTDIIGFGESLNPLDIVTDDFNRPGGIRDVYPDAFELAFQSYPEPESGKSDNTYWRDGGRDLVVDLSIFEVLVEGYEASLAKVAYILQDRKELELTLRWVVGIDINNKPLDSGPMPIEQCDWVKFHDPADVAEFCKIFRARMASHLALMTSSDSRTFDSFLSGAQKALAPIGFPRIAGVIGKSTFNPSELKDADKPVTLFIVPDSSRPEASERWLAIVLWMLLTTWKRHADKKRPVYHIFDEATNYTVPKIGELLTWGRGSGIRMHLIFQDLNAFEKKYSKETLETLLSETEIKQFLPGQRSPRTLELISKQLGKQSLITSSFANGGVDKGMQWNTSEAGRPLMLGDEIRRTDAGILFLRRCKPILIEPISYAEVHPWRDQVGPNPYHGNQPFKKKVKVKF
jgi:type IV secretion system protein VirD4